LVFAVQREIYTKNENKNSYKEAINDYYMIFKAINACRVVITLDYSYL